MVHRGEADAFEQALNSRYGSTVGTGIMAQYGTFQKVRGPASATMEKGMQLIDMAYRNQAIQGMVELMAPVHPDEIVEAEYTWSQGRKVPEIVDNARRKTVMYLKEGEVKAYHVPAALADAWRSGDAHTNMIMRGLNNLISRPLKSLYVQWPFGIWPILWIKDIQAYKRYMPARGKFGDAHYFRHLPRALKAAASMSKGDPNADARRAMEQGLTISDSNFMGFLTEEQSYKRILKRYNQTPADQAKTVQEADNFVKALWEKAGRGKEWYLRQAQVFERTSKIVGMLYMEENFAQMPQYHRNQTIRQFSGSPDFLESPTGQPLLDMVMLFYNPWKLGLQQELDSYKGGRARYALQHMKWTLPQVLLEQGMKFGWFTPFLMMLTGGDEEKAKEWERMFQSISKYDLRSGLAIPLGWDNREERTVRYLRLPFAEGQRLPAMLFSMILEDIGNNEEASREFGARLGEMLSYAGDQVPGKSPMINLWNVIADYGIRGQNPVDPRYNYPILSHHEARARDHRAWTKLGKYAWNQIGGGIVGRFDLYEDDRPETDFEEFIKAPFISSTFGRVIKVSNRGLYDTLKPAADAAAREQSRDYLDLKEAMSEGRTPELRNQYDVDTYRRELRKELDIPMTLEERILESFPTKIEREAVQPRLRDILD